MSVLEANENFKILPFFSVLPITANLTLKIYIFIFMTVTVLKSLTKLAKDQYCCSNKTIVVPKVNKRFVKWWVSKIKFLIPWTSHKLEQIRTNNANFLKKAQRARAICAYQIVWILMNLLTNFICFEEKNQVGFLSKNSQKLWIWYSWKPCGEQLNNFKNQLKSWTAIIPW